MKKTNSFKTFFLALFMLIGTAGAYAANVSDVLTADKFAATSTSYRDFSGVLFTSPAVYAGNSAKTATNGIQLRTTNSNSGIVTTTSGGKVKSITVVWETNTANGRTLDVYGANSPYTAATDLYGATSGTKLGSIVHGTSTALTVDGDYAYVGIRSNNGALYVTSITIEWEERTPASVKTPVFSVASGTIYEAQNVTITSETEGSAIYYTTNGDEPTATSTAYAGAIAISQSTTLKAVAIKNGESSATATAVYTFPTEVADIAAFLGANTAANNTVYRITGTAVVVYQNGQNLYVKDNSGSMLIYGSQTATYTNGQTLAGICGTYGVYGQSPQMIPTRMPEAGAGSEVMPTTITAMPTKDDVAKFVKLEGITFNNPKFSTTSTVNDTIQFAGERLIIRDNFRKGFVVEVEKQYDVVGLVASFNGAMQVYPISVTAVATSLPKTTLTGITFDGTTLHNPNGIRLSVHSLTGAVITTSNGNIDLSAQPRGVYLVRSGKSSLKIVR